VLEVTWPQALAWRMRRHEIDPVGHLPADEVVRRLAGVQAQVASSAELAIRVRSDVVPAGAVAEALARGDLIKTWAMRGTLHLLTPEDAGPALSLLASARPWERPAWQRWFGMDPATMERFRDVVIEALDGRSLTREELIEVVLAMPGMAHLGDRLRSGWGTLFKPVAWQGGLCFGPQAGNRVTFRRPDQASHRWAGVPAPEIAGPRALVAYLDAYGPSTANGFRNWLSRGLIPAKHVGHWIEELGDRLTAVNLEGETAWVSTEHADDLAGSMPSSTVRLLGGFDQWVLGPGTDDGHVIPATRRSSVSRTAGWIVPVALVGGVVSGTWEQDGRAVRIEWFREAGAAPRRELKDEVARLSGILGRDLALEITRSQRPRPLPGSMRF
jgi:winged helix DNA-binding protein